MINCEEREIEVIIFKSQSRISATYPDFLLWALDTAKNSSELCQQRRPGSWAIFSRNQEVSERGGARPSGSTALAQPAVEARVLIHTSSHCRPTAECRLTVSWLSGNEREGPESILITRERSSAGKLIGHRGSPRSYTLAEPRVCSPFPSPG